MGSPTESAPLIILGLCWVRIFVSLSIVARLVRAMNADPVFAEIARWGVVPVIAIESVEWRCRWPMLCWKAGWAWPKSPSAPRPRRKSSPAWCRAARVARRRGYRAQRVQRPRGQGGRGAVRRRSGAEPGHGPCRPRCRVALRARRLYAERHRAGLGTGLRRGQVLSVGGLGRRRHAAGAGRAVRPYRRPFHADRRHQPGESGELPLLQVGGGGRRHVDRPAGRPRRRQVADHP